MAPGRMATPSGIARVWSASARVSSISFSSYGASTALRTMNSVTLVIASHTNASRPTSQPKYLKNISMPDATGDVFLRLRKVVPQPAHRLHVHAGRLELAAQPVHVDFDRVRRHVLVPSAQVLDELLLADHPAAAQQQQLEHGDLARRQIEHIASHRGR